MALFRAMTSLPANAGTVRKALFCALLLAVAVMGTPRAAVHTHPNATLGHSHDSYGNDVLVEIEVRNIVEEHDLHSVGLAHVHDVGTQPLILFVTPDVAPAKFVPFRRGAPPPATRPPDNPASPLYRPPIA